MRRKPEPKPDLTQKAGEVAADVLAGVLSNLRAHPIMVKHEVTRNIPRPTYITVIIRDQEGREWRRPPSTRRPTRTSTASTWPPP